MTRRPDRPDRARTRARVRASRVVARLAATTTLLALIAGTPALVLTVHGNPAQLVPTGVPTIADLPAWVWRELRWAWHTGTLIPDLLAFVAWATWLALTGLAVVELAAQLRHGATAAHRALAASGPRRWIGGIITTSVLAGTLDATASAATASGPGAVATAPQHPGPAHDRHTDITGAAREQLPRPAEPEPTTYTALCPRITVVVGDSVWGLAEQHLRDGSRYREIFGLNTALLAAGGPHHLEPGWELLLPPDATNLPAHTRNEHCDSNQTGVRPAHFRDHGSNSSAGAGSARTVKVGTGDTLTSIAARELGNPDRWRDLYDANTRRPQPDGRALLHPDVILPGWTLHIHGSPDTGTTAAHDNQGNRGDRGRPRQPGNDGPVQPRPGASPDTPQTRPRGTAQEPPRTEAGQAEPPGVTPAAEPTVEPGPDAGPGVDAGPGLYVAVSLAAAVSTALAVSRARHRRRAALRGHTDAPHLPVPPTIYDLHIAHLSRQDHEPVLDHPGEATDGEISDGSADGISDPAEGHAAAVSLPVGSLGEAELAFGQLAPDGLGVTGPGTHGVCRNLLTSALAAPDGTAIVPAAVLTELDDLATGEVRSVPAGEAGPAAPASPGLAVTSTHADAIRAGEALIARRDTQPPDPRRPWPPALLVMPAAGAPSPHLTALARRGAKLGLSVLVVGRHPDGTTVAVDTSGHITSSTPSDDRLDGARLYQIPAHATRDLLALITPTRADTPVTGEPDELASPPADNASGEPAQHPANDATRNGSAHRGHARAEAADGRAEQGIDDSAVDTTGAAGVGLLHIRLLGPLCVRYLADGDSERIQAEGVDVTSALQPRPLHLLAFLALHPDGVHRDVLVDALWGESIGDRSVNVVGTTVSRLRRQLARVTTLADLDPIQIANGRLRLDPDTVRVDYWNFIAAERARRTATTEAERDAARRAVLAAYTATLADGLHAGWIEPPREAARLAAVDAATALARNTAASDPAAALGHLERACALDPYNDLVYRDSMRLQARLGRHDAIPRTLARLHNRLNDIGEQPQPHTIELARRLTAINNGERHTNPSDQNPAR